ncbi:hypothetical protein A0257_10125 [Hymenobacter psoromatis]|nr:hypothetical protein A0257_10125 [Hymenobacter psoromatis]
MKKSYFLLLLLALAGCAGTRPPTHPLAADNYCEPPLLYHYDPALAPQTDLAVALTPALLARYPRRTLLTANALGLLPGLRQLLALQAAARQQPGPAAALAVAEQRQRLLAQVVLAGTTIGSVAAELDCEGERADQLSTYLAKLDSRRVQRYNTFSLLAGAGSGIGATVASAQGGQYGFAIGGGVLTAVLGLLALKPPKYTADFQHPRNLLTAVWTEQADSARWPPSLWYLLTNPAFSNYGRASIAHNTRLRWQHYGPLAHPDSKASQQLAALLFGSGGQYSGDQLAVRADLLNELQAAVRLFDQERQSLLLTLNEE